MCGTGQCQELLSLGQAGRLAVAVGEGCVRHLLWARHLGSPRGHPIPGLTPQPREANRTCVPTLQTKPSIPGSSHVTGSRGVLSAG